MRYLNALIAIVTLTLFFSPTVSAQTDVSENVKKFNQPGELVLERPRIGHQGAPPKEEQGREIRMIHESSWTTILGGIAITLVLVGLGAPDRRLKGSCLAVLALLFVVAQLTDPQGLSKVATHAAIGVGIVVGVVVVGCIFNPRMMPFWIALMLFGRGRDDP